MHTQDITPVMEMLPFYHLDGGVTRKILVLPDEEKEDEVNESGILIPASAGVTMQSGTIVSVCDGSLFSVGDRVTYNPIPRTPEMAPLMAVIDGVTYHHILEDEAWEVNGDPVNRLYVAPHSGVNATEDGILTVPDSQRLLSFAKVVKAPKNSLIKAGDDVAYRQPELQGLPKAIVGGVEREIVMERNVFVVNGKVSPKRITVEIDCIAQRKLQSENEHGTLLHPNFIHMTRMLQYATISEVGSEALKMYPGLEPGDYVATHHTIEHHGYRILGVRRSPSGNPVSEFRTINCAKSQDHEIFAKLIVSKKQNKLSVEDVIPYGDLFFFEWGFNVVSPGPQRIFSEFDGEISKEVFDVSGFRDLERLRLYIDNNKRRATEQYKAPYSKYATQLQRFNPNIKEQKDQRDHFETKIEELKRSADEIGRKLGQNFLLACKIVAPKHEEYTHVVTTYKELYPIKIMNRRFLIGYKHFIVGFLKSIDNMSELNNFVPSGTRVLVEAIEETKQSEILIPNELIQERPEKGIVVKVGPGADGVKMLTSEGDFVWFRKGSGIPIRLDGKEYLIFRQNEDLMGFSNNK